MRGFNSLQPNSLRNRTGNFQRRCSEPLGLNRELCLGFASLMGVLILELDGTPIAEGAMESACVVDLINEVRKVGNDVCERFVVPEVNRFDLQRLHEALGLGVVIRVATAAHGTAQAVGCQKLAVWLSGVLRPPIRMMDTPGRRPAAVDC